MEPTVERFRRLSRSAPYRWRQLVLQGTWQAGDTPLRVSVTRPDRVRVEHLGGATITDGRHGSLSAGVLLTADGRHLPALPASPPAPDLDADGLVTTSRRPWDEGPEVPYWRDYRFVAVLDPYELSEGVDVVELSAVERAGRVQWEALLRPGEGYQPRCACCPLLRTRETDAMEGLPPLPAYADFHRVRLDLATGVCTGTREVGGPHDGQGHDLVVVQAS